MAKRNKRQCQCHSFMRDEDRHFLLTTHHPECPQFNPSEELHGLEMQCRHFMGMVTDLKVKVKELKKKLSEVDSLLEA